MDIQKLDQQTISDGIEKLNEKELQISVPVDVQKVTYSYDRILNEIQEHTEKLNFWNNLKVEADKLNLSR